MRTSGRVVKQGEQPMKMAKAKASTVGKMRALEVAGGEQDVDGGKEGTGALQGLYAQNQTEVYVPPPVIDVSPVLLSKHHFAC
jgi:xeroderma pigmentosum group C-complementing protein